MDTTTTCPACRQEWAVNTTTLKASPGHRSAPERITVPQENIYGDKLGGTTTVASSRWVAQGAPQTLVRSIDTGAPTLSYLWVCQCGQTLEHLVPAVDLVKCSHDAGPTGLCRVAERLATPPTDLYVNPRHGAACPCCSHAGAHYVRRDGQGHRPACLGEA